MGKLYKNNYKYIKGGEIMNNLEIKRIIFDLFDYSRELYNVFYRTDKEYTEEDLQVIEDNINIMENKIKEIKEELK